MTTYAFRGSYGETIHYVEGYRPISETYSAIKSLPSTYDSGTGSTEWHNNTMYMLQRLYPEWEIRNFEVSYPYWITVNGEEVRVNIYYPQGYTWKHTASGEVTTAPQDTRVYRYQGNVTKPAVDTRVWQQDYAGYIYQGGYDNYYKYKVEIEYIDDRTPPTLSHTLSPSSWTNGNVTINIKSTDTESGVREIELPNGSKVNSSNASYTVTSNGTYTFYSTDNANNRTQPYTVTISNIDREPPTNGAIELKSSSTGSVEYDIKGSTDKAGFSTSPVDIEFITETKGTIKENRGFKGKEEGLKPNELVKVRYRVKDILNQYSQYTAYKNIYTLAQQPTKGEIREFTSDSVKFKYEHPIQQNNAKYRFKAISSKGHEVYSNVYDYDSLVEIKGLKKNVEYTIYATGINNDNIENSYIKITGSNGEDLKVIPKNKTQMETTETKGWNKHKYKVIMKDIDKEVIKAEVRIGDKIINLDDNMFKVSTYDRREIDIVIDKDITGVSRSIEGNLDIFNVGYTNNNNGVYDVEFITSKAGDTQKIKLGEFGIDTIGPTSEIPNFNYLSKDRGILMINTSKIKDISSTISEIEMDIGRGYESIKSQVMMDKPISKIKLKDKLGNISEIDVNNIGEPIEDDEEEEIEDEGGDPDIPPSIEDNIVTVPVPSGGTHMQTSLNGVTWSKWEIRKDTTKVTLPVGDGLKTVYVRTGIQKYKETPVFNSETGKVEIITQEGGEVEPLNNQRLYRYVIDLTPPKLSVRTMDNSLIAINGNITFLVDVVDNLDEQPKVTLEVLERDLNGVLKNTPVYNRTVQIQKGRTTGTITPTKLRESRNKNNKLQPYTLRVTSYDKSGNKSVEHLNFYVKNK